MLIIGIAGGTGSGKTTVVRKLMQFFPEQEVAVLSQDAYYKDNSHLSDAEKLKVNFDHPESLEFDLLVEHLQDLKKGKSIEEPIYSYLTCSRSSETRHIEPRHVVILEGILIFTDPRIRHLCDIKVFVDAEADERLLRIIKRDIEERGRTIHQVIERYGIVKEMHIQFIEPTKRFADIILPQGGENAVAIRILSDTIRMKLREMGEEIP
jgi:uridine kinase